MTCPHRATMAALGKGRKLALGKGSIAMLVWLRTFQYALYVSTQMSTGRLGSMSVQPTLPSSVAIVLKRGKRSLIAP